MQTDVLPGMRQSLADLVLAGQATPVGGAEEAAGEQQLVGRRAVVQARRAVTREERLIEDDPRGAMDAGAARTERTVQHEVREEHELVPAAGTVVGA